MLHICLFEKLSNKAMDILSKNSTIHLLENPYIWKLNDRVKKKIDAIIIRAKGSVTKEIISECPRLKVIGRHGVGLDNIDGIAAQKRGCLVINTPLANYNSVAEYIVGLMLLLSRNILKSNNFVQSDQDWLNNKTLIGFELSDKNVGIIGAGNIGIRLATILADGFNMNVYLYDYKNRKDKIKNTRVSIMDNLVYILECSDFLTFNIPVKAETRNLFSKPLLDKLKKGCMVVNTARGEIVDQDYLVSLLVEKKIGGLALDVYKEEPFFIPEELKNIENFICTPHIAYLTYEALERMSKIAWDVLEVLKVV